MSPVRVHVNPPAGPEGAPRSGFPAGLLRSAVEVALRSEGVEEAEISVTLLADEAITELNRRWLDRDHATDVVAFPLHDAGDPPLGDVYIGVDRAREQAEEAGVSEEEELVRLAVHGTLHVLGWEHPEGEERTAGEMWMLQERIVRVVREERESREGG